jgi:hypothetical protein
MADTIKILSWNIEKFGPKQLNDPAFIDYADVVGIMEIVGWVGKDVKDKLLAVLSATGVLWRGAESEMTPSKPHEQYVLLWRDPVTTCTVSTYGIVGDEAFNTFFKSNVRWTQTETDKFWGLLQDKGYIDDNYILTDTARVSLTANFTNLDLTTTNPNNSITLDNTEKQAVVNILLADDALTFPQPGARPPFVAKLTLVASRGPDIPMLLVLYHAPGPGGFGPSVASNQLGLIPGVQTATKAVVMGDFNVKSNQFNQIVQLYKSDHRGQLQNVLDNGQKLVAYPFQRLTGPQIPVTVITTDNQCFTYTRLLANPNTSIGKNVPGSNVVATDQTVAALLSEPYDNFYAIGLNPVVSSTVVPLISQLVPKYIPITNPPNDASNVVTSTTTAAYDSQAARHAASLWNAWWDGQAAKGIKASDIIKTYGKFNPNDVPPSLQSAHVVFRYAISDHLPILTELTYA